ncbi:MULTISPECIES: Rieske (2Fe-2S) protein [unclassified Streptomyces]|uniref:Rieske (2Fe-2S) protein n=1 Tax=unclassified Streptomyces TaxID=2593676 RepID=UPI002DDBBD5A|nr:MULTISPECIES: Rieske (2Fe-2S) protein [unclassified Streptomyces]WSF86213.1 Rieske (2Fe-2S) protein [Streptomyces sp. NBC_01744]WSC37517.1 Rieske (2Fe-2S) protein [Streptomyces sp. NBC_01763]WSC45641.1 Rieske (2Fe-2S) protein [Streptomyces sp. NBC_01762]WSC55377.1 Rieske (2Fe-2S) protein [Streptomyces sp. NBC_01761]WSJ52772.1 Rieske (2Fe-2S) protein [Streptomyces sp. NBC_01318]
MSVTEQPPTGDRSPHGDARKALHDRIAADSLTTRRDYLRIVATVSGGLAVGGLGVAGGMLPRHGDTDDAKAPEPRKITAQLLPGESIAFSYPEEDDKAVAVRMDDGTLVGYSAICTHLACAVLWRKDRGPEGELYCPCHEGIFDVRTGEVTAGPPPRPLPKVALTEQADGSVWAIGTTRSGESIEHGVCRQISEERPDLASRIGCPSVRDGGAEAPPAHAPGAKDPRTAATESETPGRRT